MKRYSFAVWADVIFVFAVSYLFFIALWRYVFRSFIKALPLALLFAGLLAALAFRRLSKKSRTSALRKKEREECESLALQLAFTSQEEVSNLIAALLSCKGKEISVTENRIFYEDKVVYPVFRMNPLGGDDIACIVKENSAPKAVVYCNKLSAEGASLAASFQMETVTMERVYTELKEAELIPPLQSVFQAPKKGFRQKLEARLARKTSRAYAFSGVSLLLVGFISIYPVYYIVSGGILLCIAVLIRFFGKKE